MPGPGYETRHDACDALHTHRHGSAYAALVLDGSHVETSADGPFACIPGMLVLHPRWHAHGNRFGRQGAHVINIELENTVAPDSVRALRVADLREARKILEHAPHQLADLFATCEVAEQVSLPEWQRAFLHALQFDDAPVAALAKQAGVSLAHASRTFAKSHGMSPQLLRRELRSRRALDLLGGDLTLTEVAAASGFSDQSHLHRTLHSATGLALAALRREIKSVQDRMPPGTLQ